MQENESVTQNTEQTPIVEKAKDTAQQAVQQGQQVAGKAVDNVRNQVKGQINTQKDRATTALSDVANAVLLTGNQLRDQGQDKAGDYSDRFAEQITSVSNYLKTRDVDDLVQEVNDLARRQPALFVGTALVLGVLASRFFKSSGSSANQSTALVPAPAVDTIGSRAPYNSGDYLAPSSYAGASTIGTTASDAFVSTDADLPRGAYAGDTAATTSDLGVSSELAEGTSLDDTTVVMSADELDEVDILDNTDSRVNSGRTGARPSNAV